MIRRSVLLATLAAVIALGAASQAPATVFCDPNIQDCQGQQAALATQLFNQLNGDLVAFPPNPIMPALMLAMNAERFYPPSPIMPSDYCPSYGAFGGLQSSLQGIAHAFPPNPLLVADVAAIRSAAIWTFFPPNPISPAITAACIK